ncbi:MAG: hypothetical protein HAW66_01075 [Shewanella sp.]|nr:hypothetical protein [Shewanella sp.]
MATEQVGTSKSIVAHDIDQLSHKVELHLSLHTSISTSSCEHEYLTEIGSNEVGEKISIFQQDKIADVNLRTASDSVVLDNTLKSNLATQPTPLEFPANVKIGIPLLTKTEIKENLDHFEKLKSRSEGLTAQKKTLENKPCFNDTLPLHEDNAVELKGEKGLVHANVIKVQYENIEPNSNCCPIAIASAYPSPSVKGIQNFWQMALEQDTKLIIDFTELNGRFVREEHWYYPTEVGDTKHYQDVEVKLDRSVDYHDKKASLSVYQVTDKQTGVSKEVKRYHETEWQEMKGLNPSAFIDLVESTANDKPNSLIVHCRAGLGRTMTFYAGLELYHMVKLSKVDRTAMQNTIDEVVMSMRHQRSESAVSRSKQRETLLIATKYWLAVHNAKAQL